MKYTGLPFPEPPKEKDWEFIKDRWNLDRDPTLTVLDDGVWMEIELYYGWAWRKVRALVNGDVYYDGTFCGMYSAQGIGSSHKKYRIGEDVLDCTDVNLPSDEVRKMTYDFIMSHVNPAGNLDTFGEDDMLDI